MGKYNLELDLDSENSLAMIINMIEPESKVLEFGPANGRLTKYLSEKMKCNVDIVEIDETSGREASQYSNKSLIGEVLGDIEKYNWLDELKGEKYDYIIFADVLEHLRCPQNVLKSCNGVLKSNGSIIVSIPNIAHNSIIIDLINNEFKYNELGLLDNTHISFFSYNSLIRMINETGYRAVVEKASYSRVGENEINNSYKSISRQFAKELRKREKANVYQFLFELKKKEYIGREYAIKEVNFDMNLDINLEYEFVCYIKEKADCEFRETKTIRKYINPSHVCIKIDFKQYKEIQELRIDPITTNCIIDIINMYTIVDDKKIDINILNTNGINLFGSLYMFSSNDPQIYIDIANLDIKNIYYECIIKDYDSDDINKYEMILKSVMNNTNAIIEEKQLLIEEKQLVIGEKQLVIEEKQLLIEEKQLLIEEKQLLIKEKEKEKNDLNNELDKYILNYNEALSQIDYFKGKLSNIEREYNDIVNSKTWRMTKPIRLLLDSIKK